MKSATEIYNMSKAKNIEETQVQALNGAENNETRKPAEKEIKPPKKSKPQKITTLML
jgi:hypothetical protein